MNGYRFDNTRWSLVQRLREDDAPRAALALNELCQIYWRPLYAFVRRSGRSHHEAEDLTQGFFSMLLEKDVFARADAEKSRLRNYLLASLKHYLINDYHHANREKRGGGATTIAIDMIGAERHYEAHLSDQKTPESVYEREWALTLLDRVLEDLGQEMAARGQKQLFSLTKGALLGEGAEMSYQAIGEELNLSESAIKVAVHRLRRRYRQLLRRHVADTLDASADPDAEIDSIIAALRPGA